MNDFERDKSMAETIARLAAEKNGRAYYVGGFVRDRLLNIENKDFDIEVHGLAPAELEEILDSLGDRISIGESFGIYALKGYSLDIAMPRKEKLYGTGHKDFDIFVDPYIGTRKAAERRDFTINAMMQDVLSGEITDHFGGMEDLKSGVLRHVSSETFREGPLRVLRAAQFTARFHLAPAEETIELCRSMNIGHLAKERVEAELKKALLKSDEPSVFFETLRSMDQLSVWFPEVEALIGVPQDPVHHPEGDVWNHTMLVLDAAAAFRDEVKNSFGFMLAALSHDFGKTVCTERVNGRIHAYRHETEGLPLAEAFLERLTEENRLREYTLNLVTNHMRPFMIAQSAGTIKSTNRLFDEAVDPEALICLSAADNSGKDEKVIAERSRFLYERLAIYRETMSRPYVMGKDLMDAGLQPGESFSQLLAYAHKLRLAGIDKQEALKQTLSLARKRKD